MAEMFVSIILSYVTIILTMYLFSYRLGVPDRVGKEDLWKDTVEYAFAVPAAFILMVAARLVLDVGGASSIWGFEAEFGFYNDAPAMFYLIFGKWVLFGVFFRDRVKQREG